MREKLKKNHFSCVVMPKRQTRSRKTGIHAHTHTARSKKD